MVAAYLYSSLSINVSPAGGTLNGQTVNYNAPVVNAESPYLAAEEADVTSIVTPVVTPAGGTYTFTVGEANTANQDGEGLIIVYSNPAIATSTVGILDGYSAALGDTSMINFATPLNTTAPGFTATMAIMDGFSYDTANPPGQSSDISVDGSLMTSVAGGQDDCDVGYAGGNGCLITVGGPNTGFTLGNDGLTDASPTNPQTTNFFADHEYYNLTPFITNGDTSIVVNTLNPSTDDNIFEETFYVTGNAAVNAPPTNTPEPSTFGMLGLGLLGLVAMRRYQGVKLAA